MTLAHQTTESRGSRILEPDPRISHEPFDSGRCVTTTLPDWNYRHVSNVSSLNHGAPYLLRGRWQLSHSSKELLSPWQYVCDFLA